MRSTRPIYTSLAIALVGGVILWRAFKPEKCTEIVDGIITTFLWVLSLLLVSLILPKAFQRYKEQKDQMELLPIGMVVCVCGCYVILLLCLSVDKAFIRAETTW